MEDVPESIRLLLADEETDIEVSNEDADKESDLSDVEKLVMLEDSLGAEGMLPRE